LPGEGLAENANVTNYSRGINGIMVDIAGSHPNLSAADFVFRVGSNNAFDSWALAPHPTSVTVLAGQGDGGSDRVVIIWPDGAIKNTYLQVVVQANANTGLAASDEFYWGNKIADTGKGTPTDAFVTNGTDSLQVMASTGSSRPITNVFDFNRDGKVDGTDSLIVFASSGKLPRIDVGSPAPLALPAAETTTAGADWNAAVVALATPRPGALSQQQAPAVPLAAASPLSAARVDQALAGDWWHSTSEDQLAAEDDDDDEDPWQSSSRSESISHPLFDLALRLS
jgi:hypothetical protein